MLQMLVAFIACLLCSLVSSVQIDQGVATVDDLRPDLMKSACAALSNQGTHYSVEIGVGTPAQHFEVVADTGSDNVIIPSCLCRKKGNCRKDTRCFNGPKKSSSFVAPMNKSLEMVSMEFGSGTVEAAVVSDVVRLGSMQAMMQHSLLLMVDNELQIPGRFEGILGLGPPRFRMREHAILTSFGTMARSEEAEPKEKPSDESWVSLTPPIKPLQALAVDDEGAPAREANLAGFLQFAHVQRYSICFNDGDTAGVLRLNPPAPAASQAMGSLGKFHWGLDFRGISVGSKTTPAEALFCTDDDITSDDQKTPCGLIPDTGTTVILGPEAHIANMLASLCDEWPRCKENHKPDAWGAEKHETFLSILRDCESYQNNGTDLLEELPNLHLHMRGTEGNAVSATLTPYAYVMALDGEEEAAQLLSMGINAGVAKSTSKGKSKVMPEKKTGSKVCVPAFGTSDYHTKANGAIWVVGVPLFFEYNVNFDLSTDPPGISVSESECGSCEGDMATSFLLGAGIVERNTQRSKRRHPTIRRVHGTPRVPRRVRHHDSI